MKVTNIHKRKILAPATKIGEMLNTLATDNDMLLATDKWPRMRLDKALEIGSKGGHGPIKYFVKDYQEGKSVTFQFDMTGFDGTHKFEILDLGDHQTELFHIIYMNTSGWATIKWALAIRWLHDAYIEDAFDKVENNFSPKMKNSEWGFWVKFLRKVLSPRRKRR